ncbi:solute carrier family 22 member 7 isoform X2 [Columba livia]|uniref:solute carrier family 22 member 7 isoform X2 n=1 Tax=Columba livia TaxID=8932 RepID=UPI0031BACAD7
MKFEDLLLETGGFGRFQILILSILCLPRINLPMHFLLHNFLAATPSHHCAIPHQEAFVNLTMEEVLLISIPQEPDGTFRSCEMFLQPQFHLLFNSSLQPENNSIIQHCKHGWVYDHSQFTSTISTQVWTESHASALASVFCRIWDAECCLRLLQHAGHHKDPHRGGSERCLSYCIAFGWVPESARWLIANSKVKQAHRHLLRCARMNGRKDFTISPEALRKMATDKNPGESYSYISLFRTPVLRKISLCSGSVWFGVAFSYYGMSMNLTGFGLNMYLSQFVFGIIEIPAKMMMYVLVNRVGRRQSQAWTLILTGLCIGANIIIPKSFTSLRSVIAIMGKGLSEAAFTVVFLYTSELYPTVLRQNGMGYTCFMARIGGALAPLMFLLDEVWRSLPEVTYCGVAVFCGSVAFLLPETLNKCLPEGIEDIEKTQEKGLPQISDPEGMPLQSLLK